MNYHWLVSGPYYCCGSGRVAGCLGHHCCSVFGLRGSLKGLAGQPSPYVDVGGLAVTFVSAELVAYAEEHAKEFVAGFVGQAGAELAELADLVAAFAPELAAASAVGSADAFVVELAAASVEPVWPAVAAVGLRSAVVAVS